MRSMIKIIESFEKSLIKALPFAAFGRHSKFEAETILQRGGERFIEKAIAHSST